MPRGSAIRSVRKHGERHWLGGHSFSSLMTDVAAETPPPAPNTPRPIPKLSL